MIGKTNVGGGGNVIAFINCTYPSGSTCTATHGSKTLRAKGTSGSYMFKVADTGSWTIAATDGTQSASTTVSVTSGSVSNVALSYTVIPENLRSTYYEVEYINFLGNGTGGTDIDTMVSTAISPTASDTTLDVEVDFTPVDVPASNNYSYSIITINSLYESVYYSQGALVRNGKFILSYGAPYNSTTHYVEGPSAVAGTKYLVKVCYTQINNAYRLYINNSETASITSKFMLFRNPVSLGTQWHNIAYNGTAKGKYGRTKIWRNSALIGDLVPCVRRSDSACGFLNILDSTFHFNVNNNGTTPGSATPGPSVGA